MKVDILSLLGNLSIKQIENYSKLNKIEKIPYKMVFFQSSLLIFILILIAGCTNKITQNEKPADAYFCKTDSDCNIKDVHNCCGYYPRCVNTDYVPDVEAVVKECKEKGVVSICGFPDVAGCKCIENKCNSIES